MFNLPLPTDSLYKFAFMFGLALIVFSLYFRDKQLNKYDSSSTYVIIDSLKKQRSTVVLKNIADSSELADIKRGLLDNNLTDDKKVERLKERIANSFGNKLTKGDDIAPLYYSIENVQYDIPGTLTNIERFSNEVSKMNKDQVKEIEKRIALTIEKRGSYETNFYELLSVGILLFVIGTIGWYVKIQLPQDELLKIQLKEAKGKIENVKQIKVRKYFEPQNLPRTQLRHRL